MTGQNGPMQCYGCLGNGHMLGECPRMRELIKDNIVVHDEVTRKYYMPDGRNINRRMGEGLADAALRLQTLMHRPTRMPVSNLVTLDSEIQNYYQQTQYDADSDDESEDDDDGPYWKVSLQATQHSQGHEEEDDDDFYADPAYQVYPAERSSTRIAEARNKASKLPAKGPLKQKFEGVFPPSRKNQLQEKPVQNFPPKQVRSLPVPPQQHQQQLPVHPVPQSSPNIPQEPRPVNIRKPRMTEDIEMKDARPLPHKTSPNIP